MSDTPTKKALDFTPLTSVGLESALKGDESAVERWKSRDPNPTVQMSVRMPADQYDTYRALCKQERRTNGDMLNELVKFWLAHHD
jgi:hypothetical protein